jgi:hypothetical protein
MLTDLKNADDIQPKRFWIDQIGVNQEDLVERGKQEQMMAQIYTVASEVITYLGPAEDVDGEAIDLVPDIH